MSIRLHNGHALLALHTLPSSEMQTMTSLYRKGLSTPPGEKSTKPRKTGAVEPKTLYAKAVSRPATRPEPMASHGINIKRRTAVKEPTMARLRKTHTRTVERTADALRRVAPYPDNTATRDLQQFLNSHLGRVGQIVPSAKTSMQERSVHCDTIHIDRAWMVVHRETVVSGYSDVDWPKNT